MSGSPLLTTSQREILIALAEGGDDELSGSNERSHRSRLRNRVRDTIQEFPFLLETLPPKDRRKLFEVLAERRLTPDRDVGDDSLTDGIGEGEMLEYGIVGTLAFLFAGVDDPTEFEILLERAIGAARHVDGRVPVDISVDISISRNPDVEQRVGERYGSSPLSPPGFDGEDAGLIWGIRSLRQRVTNRSRRKGNAEGQEEARQEMLDEINEFDAEDGG